MEKTKLKEYINKINVYMLIGFYAIFCITIGIFKILKHISIAVIEAYELLNKDILKSIDKMIDLLEENHEKEKEQK